MLFKVAMKRSKRQEAERIEKRNKRTRKEADLFFDTLVKRLYQQPISEWQPFDNSSCESYRTSLGSCTVTLEGHFPSPKGSLRIPPRVSLHVTKGKYQIYACHGYSEPGGDKEMLIPLYLFLGKKYDEFSIARYGTRLRSTEEGRKNVADSRKAIKKASDELEQILGL